MNGFDFQRLKYTEVRLSSVGMEMAPYNERFFVKLGSTSIGAFGTLDEVISFIDGYEFGISRGKKIRVDARDEEDY